MKYLYNKIGSVVSMILTASAFIADASDKQIKQRFEEKYQAWRAWVTNHWYMSTFIRNQQFNEIVALGLPVVPYIVEKIEQNPGDFHLGSAVMLITKKKFAKSEWPLGSLGDSRTAAVMYVKWWKEGRFKTGERFAELYRKWKASKADKKDKEAEETYQKIVDLGIPVMPYLVAHVEQQPELVSAISKLTDGALPPTATPAECNQWWEANKKKYEVLIQSNPSHRSEGQKVLPNGDCSQEANPPPTLATPPTGCSR
ncbi:MAG: hypothetical protein N3G20_11625 [Verrucomicrobiae bacterium]|nr:hypothetical protein [Verrucomicrobiae bacterium]